MGVQLFQYQIVYYDGREKVSRNVIATDVVEATTVGRVACDLHPGYRLYEIKEDLRPAWCDTKDMTAPHVISEGALREYARRIHLEVVAPQDKEQA